MQDDRNTINIVDIERLSFTIYFSCDNVEYSNNLPTKSIFFPIVLSIRSPPERGAHPESCARRRSCRPGGPPGSPGGSPSGGEAHPRHSWQRRKQKNGS